jgi:outer membrane protein assembly factor BamB
VVVVTSSIRLDPKTLKGAKGEVLILKLADGSVVWRKEVTGGIVSPAVVRGESVLFTGSDGKLRAWDRASGEPRWVYDAKMPIFAGPAAADQLVYVADLKGVVHAVGLDDGRARWAFDLGSDPAVQAPGMVYGTPLLHEGRLYVGTCNIEAGGGRQRPGAIVCLGNK